MTMPKATTSALLGRLPHVGRDFADEVLLMDADELRRRVLIQADHIVRYASCLDGLGLRVGVDGARYHADIRRLVETLLTPNAELTGVAADEVKHG